MNGQTSRPAKRQANANNANAARKRDYASRPGGSMSWSEADNQVLRDAIVAITDAGCAIICSRTSDGGALSITVLDGDERIREWANSAEQLDATLRWLVQMFNAD